MFKISQTNMQKSMTFSLTLKKNKIPLTFHCHPEMYLKEESATLFTCSCGGHLNSLVFLAVTDEGRLACLISLYRLSWS